MRRFFVFVFLVCFTVPFGASLAGCGSKTVTQFCNGGDSGPIVGQVKSVILSPVYATYGISLNYAQIGPGLSATAVDCKGNNVSVRSYTYATSDMTFADINPISGQVCGGTFNRNTGGGIPDFTTCSAPVNPPATTIAYVTATAEGTVSNPIPIYVHPIVTSVVIGNPTAAAACTTTNDPSTNCCPTFTNTGVAPYTGGCLSQGATAQLTARVYQNGTTNPTDNITCKVGHIGYAAQNSSIFTVDQNGVATAQQPGSTIVTSALTNSGTGGAAGFFATCPPASITLTVPNSTTPLGPISVGVNNTQSLIATVFDTNGVQLQGTALTFLSTTPTTITAGSGVVSPSFPGTGSITAVCQPPGCNPAPFSQIGLYGNGKPITSNGILATAAGTNATVLYIASTQSQFLQPVDFALNQQGGLLKLPYFPNSMVISQDGSTIYLGSSTALMTVSTASTSFGGANTAIPGTVLSVSPDGGTVVVTDPVRQTVSLVVGGSVFSTYGGVGTHAQWSPDSSTVYITTTTNTLLEHSSFTGWNSTPTTGQYNDLTVAVPSIGAFFAGAVTEGRSYCSSTVIGTTGNPPVETNTFYPVASDTAVKTDHVAATNDSNHILGVSAAPATLSDIAVTLPTKAACPVVVTPTYFPTTFTTQPLTSIAAGLTSVNGIIPASNSALSFVTYTGTAGLLPEYIPATTGAGTLSYVKLSGTATAPVTGVFSTDNRTFYTGTSGDNAVHLISITGTTAADVPASVITPRLPDNNGNIVVPNLLVQRPKKSTS